MVAFKNFFGGIMFVDESRVDDYLARGYRRVTEEDTHIKTEETEETFPEETTEETEQPKKTGRKKRK